MCHVQVAQVGAFLENTGLNEDVEGQNIGDILALKSGNNTVGSLLLCVKANALHTAVFLLMVVVQFVVVTALNLHMHIMQGHRSLQVPGLQTNLEEMEGDRSSGEA